MSALTLNQLSEINQAVEIIARGERQRLHFHRHPESIGESATLDALHGSGLISLVPDEDEIIAVEQRNMRARLMSAYASRHPAGETYRDWLIRIGNSGLRGERVDVARLYPGELTQCGHCGCVDDPERSPDRAASPHAKYCPVRSPKPEPSAKPEPEPSAKPEPEPSAKPEPEPSAKPEPEPSAKPEPEPSAKPEPEPSAPSDDRPVIKSVRATVRSAGAKMLHHVILTDERTGAARVVAERRSAHHYAYAICHWTERNGERTVSVERWSRSRVGVSYPSFPVRAERID